MMTDRDRDTLPDGFAEKLGVMPEETPRESRPVPPFFPGPDTDVLAALVTEITLLREKQEEILGHIATISDQVAPTLDALSKSPIMKMLGVGK